MLSVCVEGPCIVFFDAGWGAGYGLTGCSSLTPRLQPVGLNPTRCPGLLPSLPSLHTLYSEQTPRSLRAALFAFRDWFAAGGRIPASGTLFVEKAHRGDSVASLPSIPGAF